MINTFGIWITIITIVFTLNLIGSNTDKDKKRPNKRAHINVLDEHKNIFDRFTSTLIYTLPVLEGLQNFGHYLFPDYPYNIMRIYKHTLMPVVFFYVKHPTFVIIIFFTLYYLFVRMKSPFPDRPFIRFNVMHAMLIFLITSLMGAVVRSVPIEFRASVGGKFICNIMFWCITYSLVYTIFKCVKGQYARIPVISHAVRKQLNNQE